MKIIYIMGSGQSGSTLLTLLIGAHTCVLNGGELFTLVNYYRNFPDKLCTDGYKLKNHPLWSRVMNDLNRQVEVKKSLASKDKHKFNSGFKRFIEIIERHSRLPYIVISSKQGWRLKNLIRDPELMDRLSVIYLTRDPRAKVNSSVKRSKKKFKTGIHKSLSWNYSNYTFLRMSKKLKSKCLKIGLEPLTGDPVFWLKKIMEHAGLNYEEGQEEYFNIEQPLFSGNGDLLKRKDPIKFRGDFLMIPSARWWLYTFLSFPTNILLKYPLSKSGYEQS